MYDCALLYIIIEAGYGIAIDLIIVAPRGIGGIDIFAIIARAGGITEELHE